jgi:hypothetical protein
MLKEKRMFSLKYALAGAALFYATGDVAAESPVLQTSSMKAVAVMGFNKGSGFQNFILEKKVKGHTVSGRAYVDPDIGVTCEWMEKGRGHKKQAIGCIPSATVPAEWNNMETDDFLAKSQIKQDSKNLSVINELITARDLDGSSQFQVRHDWDIAANKVCLKTVELLEDDLGHQKVFSHQWGCFDIKNPARLDKILKLLRISPA